MDKDGTKINKLINKLSQEWEWSTYGYGGRIKNLVSRIKNTIHSPGLIESPQMFQDEVEQLSLLLDCGDSSCSDSMMSRFALEIVKRSARITYEVDFDDQIWMPLVLGLKFTGYDFVVVDEAQDLNPTQYALVRAAAQDGRLIVVGDDRQAIYGWRGAGRGMLETIRRDTKAEALPLNVTFRCGRNIVKHVNNIVPDFTAHESNPEGLVKDVEYGTLFKDVRAGDFVISRTNAPLMEVAIRLLDSRPELSLCILGSGLGQWMEEQIRRHKTNRCADLIDRVDKWALERTNKLMEAGQEEESKKILDRVSSLRALANNCADVQELQKKIGRLMKAKDSRTQVTLTTAHKAKGLERDNVWLLMDTFELRNVEDENVYYVAATRARNELNLVRGLG